MNILIAGQFAQGALESSYADAFRALGHEVVEWNAQSALEQAVPFGRFGLRVDGLLPVHVWHRRASRDLVIRALSVKPQILLVFGAHSVTPGALAQLKAALPATRLACIWPDTLLHLSSDGLISLPIFDVVFSYSLASLTPLRRMGAVAKWLPLATEIDQSVIAHLPVEAPDVVFVGNWRPERESAILEVIEALPEADIQLWGHDWGRRSRSREVRRTWVGRAAYGSEYARISRDAKVSLNIIDPTNWPSANMRFFEIAGAGGCQLCTDCPEAGEISPAFPLAVTVPKVGKLGATAAHLLSSPDLRSSIRQQALQGVKLGHTYAHRAAEVVSWATDFNDER